MRFCWIIERNALEYFSKEGYSKNRVFPEVVRTLCRCDNFEIFDFQNRRRFWGLLFCGYFFRKDQVIINLRGRFLLVALLLRVVGFVRCNFLVIHYGSKSLLYNGFLKKLLFRSDGLLVMDVHQSLGYNCKVYKFRYGLDMAYFENIKKRGGEPNFHRGVVMHGDELRRDDLLLSVSGKLHYSVYRIGQYGIKLEGDRNRYTLSNVVVLSKLLDDDLYLILTDSVFYLGLVDSSWQPAGWTAAIEALTLGKEVVLLEGLTSRLLKSSFPHLVDRIHVFTEGEIDDLVKFVNGNFFKWVDHGITETFTIDHSIKDFQSILRDYSTSF